MLMFYLHFTVKSCTISEAVSLPCSGQIVIHVNAKTSYPADASQKMAFFIFNYVIGCVFIRVDPGVYC